MKKQLRFLCWLLLAFAFLPVTAQQKIEYMIYGGLFNEITKLPIQSAKVTLMTVDSVAVDSVNLGAGIRVNNRNPAYFFMVPKKMPQYIIKFEADGYVTSYLNLPAHEFKRRENSMVLRDAYTVRKPRERKLNEVTVTATKVKFYMKNDTVVFNADAFQLAEGSMLDALIRQLPGVELKDNGEILVNGRKVESLLLNGEDFFRGNNRIMLENLPSYTVKNVQVYEKQGDLSEMLGRRTGDELYVMDVKLKKEYSIGWMGNIEGGYSTENNYLGRLFAMRYTPNSRITLIGNINNVNDTREPGQNSEWTPNSMPSGNVTTHMAGLDYWVKDGDQLRYELDGNVMANHTDADNTMRRASEDFLPGGSTFSRSESFGRYHRVSVNTSHRFRFMPDEGTSLEFRPNFSFNKTRSNGTSAAATFSAMPGDYDLASIIDSIRSNPQPGGLLRHLAVNRTLTEYKSGGRALSGGMNFRFRKVIGPDALTLNANFRGSDSRLNTYDHYLLDYPSTPDQAADYRNRWNKGRPDRLFNYSVSAEYNLAVTNDFSITPSYDFGQDFIRRDNLLYRLDRLAGWGADTDHALGSSPRRLMNCSMRSTPTTARSVTSGIPCIRVS